jgi:branched-chain amino acid transport system substrate-binding protein
VDAARQLVDLRRAPAIIGGIISSESIPVVTSVTGPAGVVQVSPASSSPTLTRLANEGGTRGIFFRTITSDALQGTAAARYAMDQGLRRLAIIHVNNDFGVNMVNEFRRAYTALGGQITTVVPTTGGKPPTRRRSRRPCAATRPRSTSSPTPGTARTSRAPGFRRAALRRSS